MGGVWILDLGFWILSFPSPCWESYPEILVLDDPGDAGSRVSSWTETGNHLNQIHLSNLSRSQTVIILLACQVLLGETSPPPTTPIVIENISKLGGKL